MRFYRPMNRPTAMTFDLDDTLYDNHPIIKEATRSLQTFIESEHPRVYPLVTTHWGTFRKAAIAKDPRLASDMSRLRITVLQQLAEQAGYSEPQCQSFADEGYRLFYQKRSQFRVSKTIHSLLDTLRQHIPLIAITNGNVDLKRVGIDGYFSACFQANINAPMKPSPVMFESALKVLKRPANEVLHVGDNLTKDVWAAHKLGFKTAWTACNRPMHLSREKVRLLPDVQLSDLTDLYAIMGLN